MRSCGRLAVQPADSVQDLSAVDPAVVLAVYADTGSINQAAKAVGICHGSARRMLVERGVIDPGPQPVGKPAARERFMELLAAGWSATRAARDVGVNERTARDWRDGVRRVGNTRIRTDGTVTQYRDPVRYTQPVTKTVVRTSASISGRYLSLPDRLVIADGLVNGLTLTAIADQIGKRKSAPL